MRHAMKILFIATVWCCASSDAIRCYQCMSNREGNCDNQGQMDFKDCESSAEASNSLRVQAVCIKVVRDIRGADFITRSCGYEGSLLHPCSAHKTADHCSTCNSDLCNESTRIIVNCSLVAVALIGYCARLLL